MRSYLILGRRSVMSILVAVVLLLFAVLCFRAPGPDPETVVQLAQTGLAEATSYRFRLSVRTVIDRRDNMVSKIVGEFTQPDCYHLQGSSYDFKLDLYHKDGELTFLDPANNQWKKSTAAPSLVTEAVLFTTSPIVDFLTAQNFNLISCKRDKGKKVYHFYTELDEITYSYWEIFFSDFKLESFVNYPDCQVQQLRLYGTNKEQEDTLLIELVFTDYNQPIEMIFPDEVDK
ncbi:MAG: hypothetical protein ACOYEO_01255 [bacterium]|jgi:hypothetical protein